MDAYKKSDFKREEYPGTFSSREEDRDMLAHHNQEMIMKGIDPRSGKVFNAYLAKHYADRGDLDARKAYHEWVYQQFTDSIHPKLDNLIVRSYNRIQNQKRQFLRVAR